MGSFFGSVNARHAAIAQAKAQARANDAMMRIYAERLEGKCCERAHYDQNTRTWRCIEHTRRIAKQEPQGKQCGGCGSRQYLNHNGQIICAYCRSWA